MKAMVLVYVVVFLICSSIRQIRSHLCALDLNAYGLNDADKAWTSWIKINNVAVYLHTYDGTPTQRGVVTMEFHPRTCTWSNLQIFDTAADENAATKLSNYVSNLAFDTILLSITNDEPQLKLANAIPALQTIGLNLNRLNYRGKWAFVTKIGHSAGTVAVVKGSGGDNARLVTNALSSVTLSRVCTLDLNAYGLIDADRKWTSWITVNNAIVFGDTFSERHAGRGINTLELWPSTCGVHKLQYFDTGADAAEGVRFAEYVADLRKGTILVAVTSEDAQHFLGTKATGTLTRLGIDVTPLNYRGKFAFVTEIGRNTSTVAAVLPSGGNNAHITAKVHMDVAGVRIAKVCRLDLNSYGSLDANKLLTSYIKINGATAFTSTFGGGVKGITMVELNPHTCTAGGLQTFDTSSKGGMGPASLAKYLTGLASGTVVIAVTSDDAQQNIAADSAQAALLAVLGVNVMSMNFRGKFIAIGQVGRKANSAFSIHLAGGSNLHMLVDVHAPGRTLLIEKVKKSIPKSLVNLMKPTIPKTIPAPRCIVKGTITMFIKNTLADIYYDNRQVVSNANPKSSFQLPRLSGRTRVISMKLTNYDQYGPGFVLSNTDGTILSNGIMWKCTQTKESNWMSPSFDDSKWPAAVESFENDHKSKRPMPFNWGQVSSIKAAATYIWTSKLDATGGADSLPVFCRGKVPPQKCSTYEVTGADLPVGACLCVNKNAVPFTDSVCSTTNVGIENVGACFKYTGKHSVGPDQCASIDKFIGTVNVQYKGKLAWVASHHVDHYNDVGCK